MAAELESHVGRKRLEGGTTKKKAGTGSPGGQNQTPAGRAPS